MLGAASAAGAAAAASAGADPTHGIGDEDAMDGQFLDEGTEGAESEAPDHDDIFDAD